MAQPTQIRFYDDAATSRLRHQVVLIVHGVNVDVPGSTVQDFASSYAVTRGAPMQAADEVIWVPESDATDLRTVRTFPAHICRLTTEHRKMLLAEVFWGDISHVPATLAGTIRGLFQIIFSLRFAAKFAARADGNATLMQRICGWIAWLIHGPVLSINLFLAIATIAAVLTTTILSSMQAVDSQKKQPDGAVVSTQKGDAALNPAGPWADRVMLGFGILVAGICLARTVRDTKQKRDWQSVDWSMIVIGMGIAAIAALAMWDHGSSTEPPTTFQYYGKIIINLLNAVWGVIAALLLVAFLVMCGSCLSGKPQTRFGYVAAFVITSTIASLWGLVIPTIWVTCLNRIPQAYRIQDTEALLLQALGLLGYLWITAVIFVVLGAATWVYQQFWASRNTAVTCPPEGRNQAPRLILGWAMMAFIMISTVVWSVLAIREGIHSLQDTLVADRRDASEKDQATVPSPTRPNVNKFAIALVGVVGLGASFYVAHLRLVLDIVLDVANHFREEWWEERSPTAGVKSTFRYGRRIRDRIAARMRAVLKAIDPDSCQDADLVIVSHSQGTVTVADVLAEAETAELLRPFRCRTLVTCGSPLTHLYQHYFPGEYPPFDFGTPRWSHLNRNVDQWVNVYRIDDFVGTIVSDPTLSRPVNIPVDKGGHTGYWHDRQFIEKVHSGLTQPCGDRSPRGSA